MNKRQFAYLTGWIVVVVFFSATLITEDIRYLLGSSLCIALFGIGKREGRKQGVKSLPFHWQLAMAIYLLVLAFYFLRNLDFVKDANIFTIFILFIFPFIPLFISSELKKSRGMGDEN